MYMRRDFVVLAVLSQIPLLGSFNKIFTLKLGKLAEVIAKISTKLVPSYHVTASEVVTMDYARTILGLPVPRVLAWSANSGEIGSEYIVMGKSAGTDLYTKWDDMKREGVRNVIEQILEAEKRFAGNAFSQIGGIYYKNDVDSSLRDRPLYPGVESRDGSDIFHIRPLPDWDIWRGQRASLHVDRGPCKLQLLLALCSSLTRCSRDRPCVIHPRPYTHRTGLVISTCKKSWLPSRFLICA